MVRAADTPEIEKKTEPKEEGPRSFGTFLRLLAEGEAESTLSGEAFELTKRLQEEAFARGAKVKGKLKLVLHYLANPDGTCHVAYDVEITAPKPRRSMATYWLTKGGNLSAAPTKQTQLPFQDVADRNGRPRDLSEDDEPAPREA